jgi:predicted RND superfamily exporter protein
MPHLPEKNEPTLGRRRWVLILMAIALPPSLWALRDIHLNNDIRNWMPPSNPSSMALDWYEEHFAQQESVLVSWEGITLNDRRVGWLTDSLQGVVDEDDVRHGGIAHVDSVVTPQQLLRRMENDGVLHTEALERLQGLLVGTGGVKLKFTEVGARRRDTTIRELKKALTKQLGLEVVVTDPVKDWAPGDDEFEDLKIPKQIVEPEELDPFPAAKLHHAQLTWDGLHHGSKEAERVIEIAKTIHLPDSDASLIEDAFFAPGSPITVAVVLSEAGDADKKGSIKEIRRVAAEIGIGADIIHLGGRPVASVALNGAVRKAAWNPDHSLLSPKRSIILFSGIVGIVLAFVMLRSVILAMLVLAASYYTVIVTVAIVPATGGSMNMVLVVMPTLLLVLTMSGAIHVANYWRIAARKNSDTAAEMAASMAAKPCFLASLTTAFGLLSLTTSPLAPVADFGMYSAIGCFVGLAAILYGLPAVLRFVPKKVARTESAESTIWPSIAKSIHGRARIVTAVCMTIFLASSAGLFFFKTETKVIKYFPDHSLIVQDYNWFERNIGGVVPIDVVIRFNEDARLPAENGMMFSHRREIVRRIQQQMVAQHPDITGSISLASFAAFQDAETLATRANSMLQKKIDATTELRMKDPESAASSFLSEAEKQTDWLEKGDGKLARKGDELWRITAQVNIMTDVDYAELTQDIERIVRTEVRDQAGTDYVVTGMVPLFLETQEAVLSSLIQSFVIAFVVIGAVISWVLKNVWAGLLTMLPNVLPISTVFGAISWYGIAVDIGTMITASVALGIAVDGTLHLLTWFREGVRNGKSQVDSIAEAMGHCGPALCQTSIAVGMGLIVLLPAELTLISRFGWLMASMIVTALIADLILLPALLSGKLGRLIIATDQKQSPSAEPPTTSSEPIETDEPIESAPIALANESAQTATDIVAKSSPPKPHLNRTEANDNSESRTSDRK